MPDFPKGNHATIDYLGEHSDLYHVPDLQCLLGNLQSLFKGCKGFLAQSGKLLTRPAAPIATIPIHHVETVATTTTAPATGLFVE
jgi:hypothetical protein